MMQLEFLTLEEVQELTGYQVRKKQCEQLRRMGIRYVQNRFGDPKISRTHIQEICCDMVTTGNTKQVSPTVNFAGLAALGRQ